MSEPLRPDERSFRAVAIVLEDLRSGRAGWPLRLGLSFAAAGFAIGLTLLTLGLCDVAFGRVDEEFVAMALAGAAAAWLIMLGRIWSGYRRWHRTIRTAFTVVGLWAVTITLCAFIAGSTHRNGGELLMGGLIVLSLGATVAIIATAAYRSLGGNALVQLDGQVKVECPSCGYSMVGLESCACPECGSKFTIDQLIIAQDYEATRKPASGVGPRSPNEAPPPLAA